MSEEDERGDQEIVLLIEGHAVAKRQFNRERGSN